jgi:carboxyl-terminal processing protease
MISRPPASGFLKPDHVRRTGRLRNIRGTMKKYRVTIMALSIILISAVAGGLFGEKVLAVPGSQGDYLKLFSEIIEKTEQNYAADVDEKTLIYGAIAGMLDSLDRHSNFLPAESFNAIREEQQGKFFGLGIVVSMREDRITVISPIEGTPAFRLGITAGDVIDRIEGETTAGMGVNDAVALLRGPKGTTVNISIARPGFKELLDFAIVRDEVPTHSVIYSFVLENGVGYIRLKNFTQTTADELHETLARLRNEGMVKLLFDLRNNSGGLLDQAVLVSDIVLPADQKIVYTRGRILSSNQEYFTTGESSDEFYENMPLVILVNRGSASASEIVAGAIQDHDRGLIVGEATWGKGLVQSVYPLSFDSGLALTTARYFTPSGRSIQRDYELLDEYFFPAANGEDDVEEAPADEGQVSYTSTGRKVTGGGGISPDVEVKQSRRSEFVQRLFAYAIFFNFAVNQITEHADVTGREFVLNDAALMEFRRYLENREIHFKENDLLEHRDELQREIRQELISTQEGLDAGYRFFLEDDQQVRKALGLFGQAEELFTSSMKLRRLRQGAESTELLSRAEPPADGTALASDQQ